MALKSCREIENPMNLEMFLEHIEALAPKTFTKQYNDMNIRKNHPFKEFMKSTIVCTEAGYSMEKLEEVVRMPLEFQYKNNYIGMLDRTVRETIKELQACRKPPKLQTLGYELRPPTTSTDGSVREETLTCNYINLNKQCMVTANWEKIYFCLGDHLFMHFLKEYLIFLRNVDDSLVQIWGTNIFTYLNEKLG